MNEQSPVVDDPRLPKRFWSKVDPDPIFGCWIWVAGKMESGYGVFWVNPKMHVAHRVAYEALVAPIPSHLQIDHLCRVRHCCNPFHLELVTARENLVRGFGASGLNARKTHCPSGHPYSGDNLKVNRTTGGRVCIECERSNNRNSYERKRRHEREQRNQPR